MAAAIGAPRPTGTLAIDAIYAAAFAALVTVAGSRAQRWTWLVLAGVAMGLSRGWWLAPGVVALLLAFGAAFTPRHVRRLGAVVGAFAVQSLLHLHPIGFHGATALIAGGAVAPLLASAYARAPEPVQRRSRRIAAGLAAGGVVCTLPLLVCALLARNSITNGARQAQQAFNAATNGNRAAASGALRHASRSLGDAGDLIDGFWTAPARLIPVVGQQRRALTTASRVGHQLTKAAADNVDRTNYDQLRYRSGTIDTSRVAAMEGPLRTLERQLAEGRDRLRGVGDGWLIPPVADRMDELRTQFDKAVPKTQLAVQAVSVAPGLLGGDGVRHYFVAFVSPSEARGLGGFIGNYGEIVADHGHLTLARSGSVNDLAARAGGRHLDGPADYLARYGAFDPANHLLDATYSPDLPAVADVIDQLYPQAGGTKLDGVLVVDPYGLAALLRLTGPIQVPGLAEPLTPQNAADILLRKQYELFPDRTKRKDLLEDASRITFDKLTTGSLPGPRALADALSPAVRQGRIGFFSTSPTEQAFVRRIGLDGAFPKPSGQDLVAVTTQNVDNNKIDVFLHRQLTYRAIVDPSTGTVRSTLTIELRNDAPASGISPAFLTSYGDTSRAPGVNRTFLSLYSPLAPTKATVDGQERGLQAAPELGWNAYSTFVDIPPSSTVTVTVQLTGEVARGSTYRLGIRHQPLVNPDDVDVEITPAAGWSVEPSHTAPVTLGVAKVTLRVEEDQELTFKLGRGG
jgi:hypothetical protein